MRQRNQRRKLLGVAVRKLGHLDAALGTASPPRPGTEPTPSHGGRSRREDHGPRAKSRSSWPSGPSPTRKAPSESGFKDLATQYSPKCDSPDLVGGPLGRLFLLSSRSRDSRLQAGHLGTPPGAPHDRQAKCRILVVEDEAMIAMLVEEWCSTSAARWLDLPLKWRRLFASHQMPASMPRSGCECRWDRSVPGRRPASGRGVPIIFATGDG